MMNSHFALSLERPSSEGLVMERFQRCFGSQMGTYAIVFTCKLN